MKRKIPTFRTPEEYAEFIEAADGEIVYDRPIGDAYAPESLAEITENFYERIPRYCALERVYGVSEIAGGGDTLTRARRVMRFLSDQTYYCGVQKTVLPDDPVKIAKFAFGRPFSNAINCRDKAILYADLLISVGIEAVPLHLYRFGKDRNGGLFLGNHVVVQIRLPEDQRWMLTDPSFNVFFTDAGGAPLDVFGVADKLGSGEPFCAEGYEFNRCDAFPEAAYRKLFLEGSLEFIGFWRGNARKFSRFPASKWDRKHIDDSYYMLEPKGAGYYDCCFAGYGGKPVYVPVGKEDLLSLHS